MHLLQTHPPLLRSETLTVLSDSPTLYTGATYESWISPWNPYAMHTELAPGNPGRVLRLTGVYT
eukprot:4771880-Pyramimonas_sp.AAC.1